ncbi:MAG: HAD-IB family phosphatase [Candidatus Thermoplasmatota archaeon]|nr:HAD-IB family phosphatase [Candidatus Thermoplasmatota archaeon]
MFLVFDMDGTLTEGDSWAATNSYFGTENVHIVDYLKGKITYERYLELVCAQWMDGRTIYYEELEQAVEGIEAREGLKELLSFAKKNGWKTGILSAGIDTLANRFLREYNFDFALANGFEYVIVSEKNGYRRKLTGKGVPGVPLLEKGKIIGHIAKGEKVISLGDTKYDVPMFERSLVSIAMDPKDEACASNATVVINDKSFYPVIDYLERFLERYKVKEHK